MIYIEDGWFISFCTDTPDYWWIGDVNYIDGDLIADSDDKGTVLMESTGLKDKNGKLIYEGDIVYWTSTEGGSFYKEVNWDDKALCCCFGNIPYFKLIDSGYFQTKVEVAGNIHKNKDLLKLNAPPTHYDYTGLQITKHPRY
jgi:hypothetical protein